MALDFVFTAKSATKFIVIYSVACFEELRYDSFVIT